MSNRTERYQQLKIQIQNAEDEVNRLNDEIDALNSDISEWMDELRALESEMTGTDRSDIESEARGEAWVRRVIRHTGHHPRELNPSAWEVPLEGNYLGSIEEPVEPIRKITLCIRPESDNR